MNEVAVKGLDSGYWFVRFNARQFVQWPVGTEPRLEDVFGLSDEDREEAVKRATQAIQAFQAERREDA